MQQKFILCCSSLKINQLPNATQFFTRLEVSIFLQHDIIPEEINFSGQKRRGNPNKVFSLGQLNSNPGPGENSTKSPPIHRSHHSLSPSFHHPCPTEMEEGSGSLTPTSSTASTAVELPNPNHLLPSPQKSPIVPPASPGASLAVPGRRNSNRRRSFSSAQKLPVLRSEERRVG